MDQVNVIVPDGPMITVHKGWRVPGSRRKTASLSLPHVQSFDGADKDCSPRQTGRHFEFVNAVKPGRNKDPEVRT